MAHKYDRGRLAGEPPPSIPSDRGPASRGDTKPVQFRFVPPASSYRLLNRAKPIERFFISILCKRYLRRPEFGLQTGLTEVPLQCKSPPPLRIRDRNFWPREPMQARGLTSSDALKRIGKSQAFQVGPKVA